MGSKPLRCAIYARVSTTSQQWGVEAQLAACRKEAERRGYVVVEEVEERASGRGQRPALDALVGGKARFDVLLVWRLDRLARSLSSLLALVGTLNDRGIALVVGDQPIDTTTPSGRLLFSIAAVFAEFEADLIRERTIAGVEAARRSGKPIGGAANRLTLTPADAHAAYRKHGSIRTAAAALGVSTATVIRRVREYETATAAAARGGGAA